MRSAVFHPEFKAMPWWWEAWRPDNALSQDPPARADVVVVGSGYGGLNTALELARSGADVVVLERGDLGEGASTRNGGMVSGGVNLGKGFGGKGGGDTDWERRKTELLASGSDSMSAFEDLLAREKIDCGYIRNGRFMGAYTPAHYRDLEAKLELYNAHADAGAEMVPRERQREAIASDFYHGGMTVKRAGHIHPALYYKGLLEAAHRAGVKLCARTEAKRFDRAAAGFSVVTSKGPIAAREVVVATNGYTGDATPELKRRLVPIASHIIATEELPPDLAASLIPMSRAIADTPRILTYYRMSPDGKRLIFGGRARFTQVGPEVSVPALHRFMTDRFPQLAGVRVTHAWTGNVAFAFDYLPHMGMRDGLHYLLACNGSGVVMMTYLGQQTARKIAGGRNAVMNAFDGGEFPTVPFYDGNPWFLPMVGAWYRARDWFDRRGAS